MEEFLILAFLVSGVVTLWSLMNETRQAFSITLGGKGITYSESVGQLLFISVLYVVGYSCFFVAISNLFFLRFLPLGGILASLAWIVIFGGSVVSGCRAVGVRQHLVNTLGHFVRNRFAEFNVDSSGVSIISFGYRLGARRFYFLKLRANGIKAVDWGPGQGNVPEKDNNWNVALWFDPHSVVFDGCPDAHGIYIVGPSGNRSSRELFGKGFINFLMSNQVHLELPAQDLLGKEGEVTHSLLGSSGKIRIGAIEYSARATEWRSGLSGNRASLRSSGTRVLIKAIRGTSIYVEELPEEVSHRQSG